MGKRHSPTHTKSKKVPFEALHYIGLYRIPTHIIMQDPTEDDAAPILPTETVSMEVEAPVPTEIASNDANMNHTVTDGRKAAKRTLPWDLNAGELLVSQDQDNPARKKPRLEEPLPTTTDQAASKNESPDLSVELSPAAAAAADNDDVNTDAVTDTQPNAVTTRRLWTLEDDAKLTRAVANTSKKKWGNNYKTDWGAVTALVPGRTRKDCYDRWKNVLDPSIALTAGSGGKWTEDEDSKLKDAVQKHGGNNWPAIAELVPGRTRVQCYKRWNNALDPSIDWANVRAGKWSEDEDTKLKDAVQTHGGKNWGAISALVPGRTKSQCFGRWHDALDPSIDRANERKGKWTAVEDSKLKDAVQRYGGKNWGAISALILGRTKIQCRIRWHDALDPSIDRANGRTGKWTAVEDSKLKDAVQTHGGKDWVGISALIPGRTKVQCRSRWHYALNPSIG
jgi:hypothetical protein